MDPQKPHAVNEGQRREAVEYFHKAYELQMAGDLDEAIVCYRKSIELCPTAEAYTFLGWTHSFLGHYEEAIRFCAKAIEVDPEFGNPWNDIGAYLIELGKLDEAVPYLERATRAKRYESYCFPYFNLGRVWEQKGEWLRAVEAYRNALRQNPHYTLATQALRRLEAWCN